MTLTLVKSTGHLIECPSVWFCLTLSLSWVQSFGRTIREERLGLPVLSHYGGAHLDYMIEVFARLLSFSIINITFFPLCN